MAGMKSDWGRKVESTLGDLGVPLALAIPDPDAAAGQSLAAVIVYFGHQQLEQGHLAEAVSVFDSVILHLQSARGGPLTRLLALAHYLRGMAHERREVLAHALDDYTMTLGLWPGHAGARRALELLAHRREGPVEPQ